MGALKREVSPWRMRWVVLAFCLGLIALLLRAVDLQILNQDFLRGEGDSRQLRVIEERATRGMILDRNGEPLAISGPVTTVWAHPATLLRSLDRIDELAETLGVDPLQLRQQVDGRASREFMYLRRHLTPEHAQRVRALGIPGVAFLREFRRYYPQGEAVSHLVGIADIDERGQEGMEKAFDGWLSGEDGRKRVLQDRRGQHIRDIAMIRPARDGNDLHLTIDQRLQYLAYRELKAAVIRHDAIGGSAIVIDARTGDILALVNQPGFNPNNRAGIIPGQMRNRAATDVFEPGSLVKPFTVAAALDSGAVGADAVFDTSPGTMRVGRHTVRDIRNFGRMDLAEALARSSNVAATRLVMDTPPEAFWSVLFRAGFGSGSGVGFPGEVGGSLREFTSWRPVERATMGYGYGLSATMLQLASAYTAFANDGYRVPLRIVETAADARVSEPVMSVETARSVLLMMEKVTGSSGTARAAAVPGYRIAGKTGTAHKAQQNGYDRSRYISTFAGIAPVSDPRLIMVVMIDEPKAGQFYGGAVAAPVFGTVMESALRLLKVPPDRSDVPRLQAASSRGEGAT
jgi:cell division protein FtsI (penicillin-binding protein 3)